MFVQQLENQHSLEQDHHSNGHNLPSILHPYGWIAKMDLAARRQTTPGDAPALHFPPVELRCRKLDEWHLDVARLLAAKDANGNGSCLSAPLEHREKRAANNPAAEEGLVI